jgi:hypothetical protein
MNASAKHLLRASIECILVPELEKRGFIRAPLSGEDLRAREIVSSFPFGRFKRRKGSVVELLEIQLARGGKAAFRFNLATVPSAGVIGPTGPILQEEVWTQYSNEYFEVYKRRFFPRWFQLIRWPWSPSPTPTEYEELVREAVKLLPNIEATFLTHRPGRNMRHVRIS